MEDVSKLLFTGQLSVRVDEPVRNMVNDHIHDFIPDDVPEDELSKKHILQELVKKAISRSVNAKELERLEKENAEYKRMQHSNNLEFQKQGDKLEKLMADLSEIQEEVNEQEETIAEKDREIERLKDELSDLQDKLSNEASTAHNLNETLNDPRLVKIRLSPAEFEVVELFRSKLSDKIGQPVTIAQMLFDLFWKYVREQKTRIAFPFFLTRTQIDKIIAKHEE